jgi:hypothetical protein
MLLLLLLLMVVSFHTTSLHNLQLVRCSFFSFVYIIFSLLYAASLVSFRSSLSSSLLLLLKTWRDYNPFLNCVAQLLWPPFFSKRKEQKQLAINLFGADAAVAASRLILLLIYLFLLVSKQRK